MAAQPVLTVGDGVIEIPEELRGDPRLHKGAKLPLVEGEAALAVEPEMVAPGEEAGNWRRLGGILADSAFDPNFALEQERLRELESAVR